MDRTLNRDTYDRFKQDIMKFVLKPGEQVSAAKLAERYHVSRTPAREALVRLETEGLVDIFPQSKSVVSRINIRRAKQEWFIRSTLELGMVDDFFENRKEQDIELMSAYNRQMEELKSQPPTHDSVYRYLACDNDFHAVTYMVAGQGLAATVISGTMTHYNRIRLLVDLETVFKDRTLHTHDQLVEYARNGDKEHYRELLKQHLDYIISDIELMSKMYPDYFEV
ncbi:MAG: GntR family transcriptional regulator [Otoolea sp.]|nr:GntR family transcriptional regulator [Clostridium sp.]MDY5483757.1 GntR family transcriptional regulator [Clostridium sp.]